MAAPSWTIDTADHGNLTARALVGDELFTPAPGDSIQPRFRVDEQTFADLREYVLAANEKTIQTSRRGTGYPYYREDLAAFDVSSLVLGLEPGSSNGADVWAVLTDGRDRSNAPRSVYEWELDCVVLADKHAYADRAAVATEFEEPVL